MSHQGAKIAQVSDEPTPTPDAVVDQAMAATRTAIAAAMERHGLACSDTVVDELAEEVLGFAASMLDTRGVNTTIILRHPVRHGGNVIDHLELRRPKGRELKKWAKLAQRDKSAVDFDALAVLSGHTPNVIDELDIDDVADALEVVGYFFERYQRVGPTPRQTSRS